MALVTPYLVSNFSGADENPLSEGGMWMKWWPGDDALRKVSQTASGQGVSTGYASSATVDTYPADIELSATVASRPTHSAAQAIVIGARLQDAGLSTHSGYMGAVFTGASNDSWRIYKITNGSATVLVQGNATKYEVGDKIGLKLSGTTIEFWHWSASNSTWTLRQSTTDSTYSGDGAIGLEVSGTTPSAGAFDDFYSSYQTGGGGQDPSESDLGPKWMNNVLFSTTGGMEIVDDQAANKIDGPCEATYVDTVDRDLIDPAGIGIQIADLSGFDYLDAYLVSSGRDESIEGYRFRITSGSWSVDLISDESTVTNLDSSEFYPTNGDYFRFVLTPTNVILEWSSDGVDYSPLFDEANTDYTGEFTVGYVMDAAPTARLDNAYITSDSPLVVEGSASDSILISDLVEPVPVEVGGGASDSIVIDSASVSAAGFVSTPSESLTVSDVAEVGTGVLLEAEDEIAVLDEPVVWLDSIEGVPDELEISDEAETVSIVQLSATDQVGVSDVSSGLAEAVGAALDLIQALDGVSWGEGVFSSQTEDQIDVSDRVHTGQIGFSDDWISIGDSSFLGGEFGNEAHDPIPLGEGVFGSADKSSEGEDSIPLSDEGQGFSLAWVTAEDSIDIGRDSGVRVDLIVPISDTIVFEDDSYGNVGESLLPQSISILDVATSRLDALLLADDSVVLSDLAEAEIPSRSEDALALVDIANARVDFHESVAQWISVIDIYTYGRLGKFVEVVEVDPEIQNELWGSNAKFL